MKQPQPQPQPNSNHNPRALYRLELVLMAVLGLVMFGMYRTCENNRVEVNGPVSIDCNLSR